MSGPVAKRPAAKKAHRPAAAEARKQGGVGGLPKVDRSWRGYPFEVTGVLEGSGGAGHPAPEENWPKRGRLEARTGTTTAEARRPRHTKTEGQKAKPPLTGRTRGPAAPGGTSPPRAPRVRPRGRARLPRSLQEQASGTDFQAQAGQTARVWPRPAAQGTPRRPWDDDPGGPRAPGTCRGRIRGRRRPGQAAEPPNLAPRFGSLAKTRQ